MSHFTPVSRLMTMFTGSALALLALVAQQQGADLHMVARENLATLLAQSQGTGCYDSGEKSVACNSANCKYGNCTKVNVDQTGCYDSQQKMVACNSATCKYGNCSNGDGLTGTGCFDSQQKVVACNSSTCKYGSCTTTTGGNTQTGCYDANEKSVACNSSSCKYGACKVSDTGTGGNGGGETTKPTCGNGVKEGSEACDDRNTQSGDGCSNKCKIEKGFACEGQGSCQLLCSNGRLDSGETCDDRNAQSGDGCSNKCKIEKAYDCSRVGSPCEKLCGNGRVDSGEKCDDRNLSAGDGCTELCKVESGWTCTAPDGRSVCTRKGSSSSRSSTRPVDEGDDACRQIVMDQSPYQGCFQTVCGNRVLPGIACPGAREYAR